MLEGWPRLKVHLVLEPASFVCEVAEAEGRIPFGPEHIVLLAGRVVHSHGELAAAVRRAGYAGGEAIEVLVLPAIEGG
ncbi:MAG: hypothetical protein HYX96_03250 [Chloroflexi bacterium]|nr:hypothetical protein [Chloroflexota bacterium]